MRIVLYAIVQCTWGILQTFVGFIIFLIHIREKHFWYRGAVVTGWNRKSSASLGLFLFISYGQDSDVKQKKAASLAELSERLLIHEYGHTIQSLLLGPLYLPVIAIPSALWCFLPYCNQKRANEQISYYSFYTEKWADRWGERYVAPR